MAQELRRDKGGSGEAPDGTESRASPDVVIYVPSALQPDLPDAAGESTDFQKQFTVV